MATASPYPTTPEPRRFSTRLMERPWIGVAVVLVGVVAVGLSIDFAVPIAVEADVVQFDVRGIDGLLHVTIGRLAFTFEGVAFPCEHDSCGGSVRIGGRKVEGIEIGNIKPQKSRNCLNDHLTLRQHYQDGECRLSVNEFDLTLLEHGSVLVCGGQRFDVGRGFHRVAIGKDGKVRILQ